MVHTEQQALDFAVQSLDALGGLPPDAEATSLDSMARSVGKSRMTVEYFFQWRPRDSLTSSDQIVVGVAERPDGIMFVSGISRRWHPAWWRALEQWQMAAHALPVPAPSKVYGACAHGIDVGAVRRVLGARLVPVIFKCVCQPKLASVSSRVAVSAFWSHPIVLRIYGYDRYAYTIPVRTVRISEIRERSVKFVRPLLIDGNLYGSLDGEHVCRV
jgi:hypothetical protein